jgi:hypothetical protein
MVGAGASSTLPSSSSNLCGMHGKCIARSVQTLVSQERWSVPVLARPYRLLQVICVACTVNVPSNLRSLHIVFAFVCLEISCAGRSRVSCTSISSLIAVFPNQFTTRAIIDLKFASCTGVQAHPRKILTTIDPVACCSKDPTPQLRAPSDCR